MFINTNKAISVEPGGVISASVAESQSYIVSASVSSVSNYTRWGDDLIIELSSGQTIRINSFFMNGPAFHTLTLVDNGNFVNVDFSHALVNADDGIADERIVYKQTSASTSVAKLLGILAGSAAVAGGVIAAAGKGHDDNPASKTAKPGLPSVTALDDTAEDADPSKISNGGFTHDTTPTLQGEGAVPGNKIMIRINGGEPIVVIVNEDGTWSYTLSDLADGDYDVRITQVDQNGRASEETAVKFTVDTQAPDVPLLERVTDNVSPDAPDAPEDGEIKAGHITNDATPTLSGTAEPGSTIKIYDEKGNVVGTGVVDKDGKWSVELNKLLSDGDHELTFTATDKAGNESAKSSPPFAITVDTKLPGQLDLKNIEIYDDASSTTPIEKNKDGEWVTSSLRPTFKGKIGGVDAVWVEIIDTNNNVVATVKVETDGTWSWTPDHDLTSGFRNYQFRAVDAAGNRGSLTKSPAINVGGAHSQDHDTASDAQHSQTHDAPDAQHSKAEDGADTQNAGQPGQSDKAEGALTPGHADADASGSASETPDAHGANRQADNVNQVPEPTQQRLSSAPVDSFLDDNRSDRDEPSYDTQPKDVPSATQGQDAGGSQPVDTADVAHQTAGVDVATHAHNAGDELTADLSELFLTRGAVGFMASDAYEALIAAALPPACPGHDSEADIAALYQQVLV